MRPLEDPRGVFPFPDTAWLTANRKPFERLPEKTRKVLGRTRLTVADVTVMDHSVNRGGLSALEAAQKWMNEHPDRVQSWLG